MLVPIGESAAALICSGDLSRVKQCANSGSGDGGRSFYLAFYKVAIEHAIAPNAAWYTWHASSRQAMLESVRPDNEAVRELLKHAAGDRLWATLFPEELDDAEVAPERADELRQKWDT